MDNKKTKILVHVCCAACASHVFSELEKEEFEITAYFYHPEVHGRAEYERRFKDLKKYCKEKNIELVAPPYDVQEFFAPLMPYQDRNSIKYISDKKRYRRKRCQLCVSILIKNIVLETKKLQCKYFTTTMLCSPYKDHDEIWNQCLEEATKNNLNFYYKDFRKGYWNGRNYARSHDIIIPIYCGCNESLEEGRLE
jgi:predicted adenine nucleotide alpha hydrolase (AANH) superfamily ATPase